MNEVNKPIDTAPNIRCSICKSEFYVHPMVSMNAPYITDCVLHKQNNALQKMQGLFGVVEDDYKLIDVERGL